MKQKYKNNVQIDVVSPKFTAQVQVPEARATTYLREVRTHLEKVGGRPTKVTTSVIKVPVPVKVRAADNTWKEFATAAEATAYLTGVLDAVCHMRDKSRTLEDEMISKALKQRD